MRSENDSKKSQLTSSDDPNSLSFYLRANTEKKNSILRQQKQNFEKWKKEEIKYLNKFLINHSFKEYPSKGFEAAEFEIEGEYDSRISISSSWQALPAVLHPKGFELSGCIIRPLSKIRLKSLACEVKLKVKIIGESSLILITRTEGAIEESSPFIRVFKDINLNGLFVMFGTVNQNNKRVTRMKQVQMPEERKIKDSKLKLEICIVDNGDSRIFMTISSFDKDKIVSQFNTHCDTFLPCFNKSRVLIGGSGEGVKIYCITAQQRGRIVSYNMDKGKECRCCAF